MRTSRIAPAVIAISMLAALAGCSAPASPEQQAEAEFTHFVEATANGGDLNVCEGHEKDVHDIAPSRLNKGAKITVEKKGDPGRYDVRAVVSPLHGPDEDRASTLWVQIDEGKAPCVAMDWSLVW